MITAHLYKQILALINTPPDFKRGDWWQYPCVSCGSRGKHKWGPLGINMATGWVKCLRCGLSGRLSLGTDSRNKVDEHLDVTYETEFVTEPDCKADEHVIDYMLTRGVDVHGPLTYGFGRGRYYGTPIFPSRSRTGKVWYFQSRMTGSGSVRYIGPKQARPRLDHSPIGVTREYSTRLLYLVEGPIDSALLRIRFGVWASPTYSIDVSESLLCDVCKSYEDGLFDRVVVWFDAEHLAEVKSRTVARRLIHMYGVPSTILRWDWNHGDDIGKVGEEELRRQFYAAEEMEV